MTVRRLLGALLVLSCGCDPAWAQPRPRRPRARDAGVAAALDAGAPLRPATHGRVDPAEVQRVIATQRDAIQRCYRQGVARDPTLHGEITVRLRVETNGAVSETTSGGDTSLREVGRCIEGLLRPLRFPAPTGGPATVAAPFVFSSVE